MGDRQRFIIGNLAQYGYGVKGMILSMVEAAIDLTGGRIEAKDIRTMVGRLEGPTSDFATNGLPQLTSAIQSLQQTADSLDRLIRDVEANPRGLVGKSPAQEVKVKP